jgi:alkanesulfonate monooxygenase SsuD/methylene tetrahydromethanopterin reductase-like flavin-dependent oxidoreductase (luciferase family)
MDVDELSGGRAVVGLGSGTARMNEEWFGVPFSRPAARMQELVLLLRAAFQAQKGGGFRWQGRFWKLDVPIYARPGAPRVDIPIWVAAVNRGMIAAAGSTADALVGHPIATRRWHREVTLPGLREAEAKAGRAAGACALAPYVLTSIQQDRELALRDAKNQIGFYFTTALYHSVLELHGMKDVGEKCRAALRKFDVKAMSEAVPDALVDEIAIACTPDEARERLAAWKDLTGDPLLYAPSVGVPPERLRANLDRTGGLWASEGVMLALVEKGLGRQDAYVLVQRNAMRAFHGEGELAALLSADADVSKHLDAAAIQHALDLDHALAHVDAVVDRALEAARHK